MMFRKFITGIVCTLLAVVSVNAQNDWKYSVGLNYRSFSDVDFKAVTFSNPAFAGSEYVNGSATDTDGDGVLDNVTVSNGGAGGQLNPNFYRFDAINGFIAQPGLATNSLVTVGDPGDPTSALALGVSASLDKVRFSGAGEDEFDEGVGFVVSADRLYKESGDLNWNIELSLTTAYADASERYGASITSSDQFIFNSGAGAVVFVDNNSIDNVSVDGDVVQNTGGGTTGNINPNIDFDMDLDVYTFAAGFSAFHESDKLKWNAGIGPSITLSNLDIDATQIVTGSAGDFNGRNIYTSKRSEDSMDITLGFYVNLGIAYNINEKWGLGVEYRFDYMFDDATTNIADVELQGDSAQVKVLYGF